MATGSYGYYNRTLNTNANPPQMNVGDFLKSGQVTSNALGSVREAELVDAKQAEEQRKWNIEQAYKQRAEQRTIDEINRNLAEKQSTGQAISAMLRPEEFMKGKMLGEQNAIEQSLANLTPEERAVAQQQLKDNYNPEISKQQWLQTAMANPNIDQSKLLSAQASKLTMDLNDPTSDAYKAKEQADLDNYKRKLGISKSIEKAEENKKISDMLKILQTDSNKTKDIVTNEAVIKNIGDKQELFGNEYVKEYSKFAPSIDKSNENINKLKQKLTGDEVKDANTIRQIEGINKSIDHLTNQAYTRALGKSGMGSNIKEIPAPIMGQEVVPKTKQEFTNELLASLGKNPSVAALAFLKQEVDAKYPVADSTIVEYNKLAESYGGKAINTSSPEVAKENAKAAIKKSEGKASKDESWQVAKSVKTLRDMMNLRGSPDVIGTGTDDEVKLENTMFAIKNAYGLSDDKMSSLIQQASPKYTLDTIVGVDEKAFIKELENKASAMTGKKDLGIVAGMK